MGLRVCGLGFGAFGLVCEGAGWWGFGALAFGFWVWAEGLGMRHAA